jgi:LacI family transcriptional regulator
MAASSIKEVARSAGVSIATVSNVLNRPHLVAAATRERVQAAIDELGYVRSEVARQLRAGRSRTVALVVLDVANPFFTDVARGAEQLAAEHDLMVVLSNSDGDAVQEERNLDQLEQLRVLGVVIAPLRYDNPQLDRLAERRIPVVLLGPGAGRGQCSVEVDNVLGGRLAGTHLLDRGHRHVAFVGGTQVEDRHTGLRQALGGRARVTRISPPTLSVEEGRAAGEELARLPPLERPTAVFCANDLAALGLLQEMTRHGIRVPTEMAIVGFDDIGFAAAAAVPLSSVRQPRELLGRAAVELLLDEVARPHQHTHRRVMFRPDLVVRESSSEHR